jgi:hypothetical protein
METKTIQLNGWWELVDARDERQQVSRKRREVQTAWISETTRRRLVLTDSQWKKAIGKIGGHQYTRLPKHKLHLLYTQHTSGGTDVLRSPSLSVKRHAWRCRYLYVPTNPLLTERHVSLPPVETNRLHYWMCDHQSQPPSQPTADTSPIKPGIIYGIRSELLTTDTHPSLSRIHTSRYRKVAGSSINWSIKIVRQFEEVFEPSGKMFKGFSGGGNKTKAASITVFLQTKEKH